MNKILLGLILGGILGIFDGLTAWFTPAARAGLVGIVFGSTFKGVIAGILIGVFARKVRSLALGILFGLIGLAQAFLIPYINTDIIFRSCARRHGRIDRRICHRGPAVFCTVATCLKNRARLGEGLRP